MPQQHLYNNIYTTTSIQLHLCKHISTTTNTEQHTYNNKYTTIYIRQQIRDNISTTTCIQQHLCIIYTTHIQQMYYMYSKRTQHVYKHTYTTTHVQQRDTNICKTTSTQYAYNKSATISRHQPIYIINTTNRQ